jgi:hypothetical protein
MASLGLSERLPLGWEYLGKGAGFSEKNSRRSYVAQAQKFLL